MSASARTSLPNELAGWQQRREGDKRARPSAP